MITINLAVFLALSVYLPAVFVYGQMKKGSFARLIAADHFLDGAPIAKKTVFSAVQCQLYCIIGTSKTCVSFNMKNIVGNSNNNGRYSCEIFDSIVSRSDSPSLRESEGSSYYEIVAYIPSDDKVIVGSSVATSLGATLFQNGATTTTTLSPTTSSVLITTNSLAIATTATTLWGNLAKPLSTQNETNVSTIPTTTTTTTTTAAQNNTNLKSKLMKTVSKLAKVDNP